MLESQFTRRSARNRATDNGDLGPRTSHQDHLWLPLLHPSGAFVEMESASEGVGVCEPVDTHAECAGTDIMSSSPPAAGPVSMTDILSASPYVQSSISSLYSPSELCKDTQEEGNSGTGAVAGSTRAMECTQSQYQAISVLGQDVFFTEEFVAQSFDAFWDD